MAVQVGMTFLGRNYKTLGIQKLHNFSVSFYSTYMVGVQRNHKLVGYTDIFYKGLHVAIKCNFTIREIMKIQNDPHLNTCFGVKKNALVSRDYGPYL